MLPVVMCHFSYANPLLVSDVCFTDVNEAPTNITIDISTVKENLPANTLVGSLTVTDPDTKQGHNCSVVESQPPAGFVPITSEFYTKNLKLYTKGPLDYESRSSYSVQVECSDQPGAGQPSYVYETPLVINVEGKFGFASLLHTCTAEVCVSNLAQH